VCCGMLSPDKTTESIPDILVVIYTDPELPCRSCSLQCRPGRRPDSQLRYCCWLCHCKQPDCNKQIRHSAEAVLRHATAGMPNTATDCWVSGLGRALQFLDVMLAVSAASRYSKNIDTWLSRSHRRDTLVVTKRRFVAVRPAPSL
jgi:hypothetical protein